MARSNSNRYRKPAKQFIVRRVVDDSLAPQLKAGDLVIGRSTRELKPGDVVLVSFDGVESIKRIERNQGDLIYLLADNTAAHGESKQLNWVEAKCIVAKVVWPAL